MLILVGNKVDSEDNVNVFKEVSTDQGLLFAKKHGLTFFTEVSAKTGEGVEELLEFIAKKLYHLNKKKLTEFSDDSDASSVSSQNDDQSD